MTALLTYHTINIQFTYLRCPVSGLQYIHKAVHPPPESILKHFHDPIKKSYPISGHCPISSPTPSSLPALEICFLPLQMCRFWTCRVNGVIRCMVWGLAFCTLLLFRRGLCRSPTLSPQGEVTTCVPWLWFSHSGLQRRAAVSHQQPTCPATGGRTHQPVKEPSGDAIRVPQSKSCEWASLRVK